MSTTSCHQRLCKATNDKRHSAKTWRQRTAGGGTGTKPRNGSSSSPDSVAEELACAALGSSCCKHAPEGPLLRLTCSSSPWLLRCKFLRTGPVLDFCGLRGTRFPRGQNTGTSWPPALATAARSSLLGFEIVPPTAPDIPIRVPTQLW